MLKKDSINFDVSFFTDKIGLSTDIIGDAKNLLQYFKPDTFKSIFCAHVIEHFYPQDGRKLLCDCFTILQPGGVLVLEAPDILKIMKENQEKTDLISIEIATAELYGDAKYGEDWTHKWGWTALTAVKYMEAAGFKEVKASDGISHNKENRDFRVQGIKI